jgi:tetratricopeptide (TPR) repeat protein/predicted Ser/Thr protein kinase
MRPESAALLGQSVGHIRIVDLLGEGGMGAVFIGFDQKLERRVALKAIRSEFRLNSDSKSRFLREARFLSQLDHPRICTIHDYVEGDDNDFLVMELVEGQNLSDAISTGLSEQAQMTVARELLDVLVEVHGQGIIHRDLKPENIMITPHGTIKVLDFGLSTTVDEDGGLTDFTRADTVNFRDRPPTRENPPAPGATRSLKTKIGTILGTAGYMSPEQAKGDPATAASDMYSAGLILQELFTGEPPFERDLDPTLLRRRAIAGETRPVTGLPTDITALVNRMKSPAPGARPSSVDARAQLQRILDQPKRRRRRALIAAAWFVVLVFAGVMSFQAFRIAQEAEKAEREAAKATAINRFLQETLSSANPVEGSRRDITVLEALAESTNKLIGAFPNDPEVEIELRSNIGVTYLRLGQLLESERMLQSALSLARTTYGPDRYELADLHNSLAVLLHDMGRHRQAEEHYREALRITRKHRGEYDADVAGILSNLGLLLRDTGDYEEAERALREAFEIDSKILGENHLNVAVDLNNLGTLQLAKGDGAAASETLARAVVTFRQAKHPWLAVCLGNLGEALMLEGADFEAERKLEEALVTGIDSLGEQSLDVAKIRSKYATCLSHLERTAEAEQQLLLALESLEGSVGDDHETTRETLSLLADLYEETGRPQSAERYRARLSPAEP